MDRATAALADNGFGVGDRVAVLSHNCWQYAVLAFATARAGVVLVPVNFMLTPEEIAFILETAGRPASWSRPTWCRPAEAAMQRGGGSPPTAAWCCPVRTMPAGWAEFRPVAADRVPRRARMSETTNHPPDVHQHGTESHPKGAMHSSRSLMGNYISSIIAGSMEAATSRSISLRCTHLRPSCFFNSSGQFSNDVYLGATSIILPRPDPELVLRAIEKYSVTNYFARRPRCGSHCCGFFHRCSIRWTCSSLRKGYYGASAMPVEIPGRDAASGCPTCGCGTFYVRT